MFPLDNLNLIPTHLALVFMLVTGNIEDALVEFERDHDGFLAYDVMCFKVNYS